MEVTSIRAIDKASVHRICSGQVVLSLATAVKELVENSFDAGASIIEVKLKEHGSEIVEVSDNGKGVKSSDFQSLTLKHHTSKIGDFSDIPFVSTFGFRGEALSSLCALSELEVITRHIDSDVGAILTFDHNGILVKNSSTHRQIGTTVVLKNIFSTFPVRHKEFIRHLRREYLKMIHLLTAYCLIGVNKCITCSNLNGRGKKTVVFSTNGHTAFKDNVTAIFGDKQMKQIIPIVQHVPAKEILEEYFLSESAIEVSKTYKLDGYISNSTHGEGRSSADRQFYFINGRPCDLPKVAKLINEVYHAFNKNQYPFVFLNISVGEGCADVNVTPDKRQIFIPDEKVLLALIKMTLLEMYGKQPSQITSSPLTSHVFKFKIDGILQKTVSIDSKGKSTHQDSSLKRKLDTENPGDESSHILLSNKCLKTEGSMNEKSSLPLGTCDLEDFHQCSDKNTVTTEETSPANLVPVKGHQAESAKRKSVADISDTSPLIAHERVIQKRTSPPKLGSMKLKEILKLSTFPSKSSTFQTCNSPINATSKTAITKKGKKSLDDFLSKPILMETECFTLKAISQMKEVPQTEDVSNCAAEEIEYTIDESLLKRRRYRTVPFNMDMFKRKSKEDCTKYSQSGCYRKFRSKIAPTENQNAEEELRQELNKDSFSKMEVIGQFNLGFIIARFEDDLFIIDQHAADEKYNFEQLMKNTVLETQQLLQPQDLNLTAMSEAILLDNLNIFEMNGFHFNLKQDNHPGEKVQLVSVPVSQNWSFGKEDIDEMIFMLTDNIISMVRPSRINQMFASRACRKSVMIGTALTKPMMKKLVVHMGEIEQPWNCPHGRPTIRHLFHLNLLKCL